MRDVARAFDTVLHKGIVGEVYNIGTQKERSVLEVVNAIADHMKISKDKIQHVNDRAFNDQRYACAFTLLSKLTCMKPWKAHTAVSRSGAYVC